MQISKIKKLMMILLLSFVSAAHVPSAFARDDNELDEITVQLGNKWRIVKNDTRRGIKAYAKLENDKRFRSFKVEAMLNTSIDVLGRVLFDFDNYFKWYWQVKDIKLLKKISETEHYLYIAHNAPPTIPDRDVILHTVIEPYSTQRPYVIFRVKAIPNYIPAKPPLIRMLAEDMLLKMTPIGNKVKLEAEGYVDPNGNEPVWATNFIQRSAPYSIIKGLQYMTTLEQYQKPADNPEFVLRVN